MTAQRPPSDATSRPDASPTRRAVLVSAPVALAAAATAASPAALPAQNAAFVRALAEYRAAEAQCLRGGDDDELDAALDRLECASVALAQAPASGAFEAATLVRIALNRFLENSPFDHDDVEPGTLPPIGGIERADYAMLVSALRALGDAHLVAA